MENRELLVFAEELARGGGEILRRSYGGRQTIHFKGESTLVTDGAGESEAYLLGRIRERFPEHGLLSEESPEHVSPSAYRWIVDPLDGTTNYAHGYPCFCVSVAVEHAGSVVAGGGCDPPPRRAFPGRGGGGGPAARALCSRAWARFEGFGEWKLNPGDRAGGLLAPQGAGGISPRLDG